MKLLGYDNAGQWHGYVPAPTISGPFSAVVNLSPRRQTMVELLTIAANRERGCVRRRRLRG